MLALWNQFLMRFVWTAMWPRRWSEARRRLHNTPLSRAPQQGRRQVAVAGQSARVRQVIVDWRVEVEAMRRRFAEDSLDSLDGDSDEGERVEPHAAPIEGARAPSGAMPRPPTLAGRRRDGG